MSDVNRAIDWPTLLIQPHDAETQQYLEKLGFQSVPPVPQLQYLKLPKQELADLFLKLSDELSETAQSVSRFFITHLSLNSPELLVEFLQAQPLSCVTHCVRQAWFLRLLVRGSIFFEYQPIFHLASGELVAYECLARSRGDRGEYFSGGQLIEAAVTTQLSREFDELARQICLDSIAQKNTHHNFFINILPNAIVANPQSIADNLQQVLELGLKPERIVFELTEVEVLAKSDELSQLIHQIRDWGFGIAVDDLCGSVCVDHYAMEFRPDVVKLDRRLVDGCSQYTLKQTLIKSLLESAHQEGILVLAEGLEQQADIDFCRELGVDFAQGFGLGRPSPNLLQQPLELIPFPLSKAS